MSDVKLWLLYSNTWKYLAVCKKRVKSHQCVYKSYIYLKCEDKEDLVLNKQQWLICHHTKPNMNTDIQIHMHTYINKIFSNRIRLLSEKNNFFFLINIFIILIKSCRQHGYPWPSLATSPYHSSPPAGLQSYILCHHIAAVCRFELVILLLLGHMWGSIGIHHLRARPCFSSSVLCVWFV